MKTLSVQEASQNLGGLLRRAVDGEQIAIHEGGCLVLLQPLPSASQKADQLGPQAALHKLQSQSRLTPAQAEDYLRQVRAERLADGQRTAE